MTLLTPIALRETGTGESIGAVSETFALYTVLSQIGARLSMTETVTFVAVEHGTIPEK